MKTRLLTVAALLASTASAHAVGLDRSGQRIGILFEEGNRVELSFGYTDPSIEGQTINEPAVVGPLAGAQIDNVGDSFLIWNLGVKYELNDRLSFAIISDEPYGSDTLYPGSSASTILGGTGATVDSNAVTALARYKFNDNWSVHGGLRYQEVSGSVTLGGVAFNSPTSPFVPSGVNGYSGAFGSDGDVGYVIGAAYEIPAIALRVALTYNSGTTHELATTETVRGAPISLPGATTEVDTPESLNLDFQTGIAANTLLFGSLRYARYSQTVLAPTGFATVTGGRVLTDLEDGYDFEIGVGRRFNEKWSGSVAVGFSTVGDDNLVSPLAPTNGSRHLAVGAKYDVNDQFAISGGVRYTILGDAVSAPGGRGVANFDGNNAVSVGVKFAYQF
ncbi:outer membrane protein transport protein [uncultured Tateyamaria sp.]|uniref:OmpP1/FadL family transporter n=1 Tax=uncultured Tateyamaria sp. TaxID=455651 RepID=UPI00260929AA|nr:outer membrane protein transport protein [uncultured Tateyamaria sp.]